MISPTSIDDLNKSLNINDLRTVNIRIVHIIMDKCNLIDKLFIESDNWTRDRNSLKSNTLMIEKLITSAKHLMGLINDQSLYHEAETAINHVASKIELFRK